MTRLPRGLERVLAWTVPPDQREPIAGDLLEEHALRLRERGVRDGFVESRGSMHGAVWGLIPMVTAEGTPMPASSALQRYLGEAAWFPTAMLPLRRAMDGCR